MVFGRRNFSRVPGRGASPHRRSGAAPSSSPSRPHHSGPSPGRHTKALADRAWTLADAAAAHLLRHGRLSVDEPGVQASPLIIPICHTVTDIGGATRMPGHTTRLCAGTASVPRYHCEDVRPTGSPPRCGASRAMQPHSCTCVSAWNVRACYDGRDG